MLLIRREIMRVYDFMRSFGDHTYIGQSELASKAS